MCGAQVAQVVAPPSAELRQDTPEAALTSHFAFLHRSNALGYNHDRYLYAHPNDTLHVPEAAPLYSGPAREAFEMESGMRPWPRQPSLITQVETLRRLDYEGASRVVASVLVRWTGQELPGMSPRMLRDARELKANGKEFRFILVKGPTGWTIDNALEYDFDPRAEGGSDKDWRPTFYMSWLLQPDAPYVGVKGLYR